MRPQRNLLLSALLLALLTTTCSQRLLSAQRSTEPSEGTVLEEAPASFGEFKEGFLAAANALRTCGDGQRMPPTWPMQRNDKLQRAALSHTRYMVRHNHFNHTGTDRSTMNSRVAETGYQWATVAENIAVGSNTISEVIGQWRQSRHGHCQAMMPTHYDELGAAMEAGVEGKYWAMAVASEL